MKKDSIVKMMIQGGEAYATAICSTELVNEAKRIHKLSRVCTAALGRTLSVAGMMASEFKHTQDRLTILIKGDGPMGGLVVCADGTLALKGYVYHPQVEPPLKKNGKLDVGGTIGQGTLTVIKDLGLKEPYSGQTELVSGEIAEDFAHYFVVSEQHPCVVSCGVLVNDERVISSGGMIVKPLPGCSEQTLQAIEDRLDVIAAYNRILERTGDPFAAAQEIFEGLQLELTQTSYPAYDCTCSKARIEQALISMGADELKKMIEEDEKAEVGCQFCNTQYVFSKDELSALLSEATGKSIERVN
ncbi:MAG: Hsp33 family molecular chaperone HslO [Christensenellales bacterium]|jgi:molecular chaperone Hsp33